MTPNNTTRAAVSAAELRSLQPLFSPTLSPSEIRASLMVMAKFVHDRGPELADLLDALVAENARLREENRHVLSNGPWSVSELLFWRMSDVTTIEAIRAWINDEVLTRLEEAYRTHLATSAAQVEVKP